MFSIPSRPSADWRVVFVFHVEQVVGDVLHPLSTQRGLDDEMAAKHRRTDDRVCTRAAELLDVFPVGRRGDDVDIGVERLCRQYRQGVLGVVVRGCDDRCGVIDARPPHRLLVARVRGQDGDILLLEARRRLRVRRDDHELYRAGQFFDNRFRQVAVAEHQYVVLE